MDCSICGKSLSLPNSQEYTFGWGNPGVIGMTVILNDPMLSDSDAEANRERMKPYQTNKEYSICLPCLLRALGVPPDA